MSSAEKVPTNEQKRQIYNYVLENPSINSYSLFPTSNKNNGGIGSPKIIDSINLELF